MAKAKRLTKSNVTELNVKKIVEFIKNNLDAIVTDAGDNATILDRLLKLSATCDKIAKSAKTIDEREAKKTEREAKKAERAAARKEKLAERIASLQAQLEKLKA